MGVLFVPYPARGHVAPMLAVAAELVSRGEDVTVVAGDQFAQAVRAVGAVPVAPSVSHDVLVPSGRFAAAADRARSWPARRATAAATAELCEELVTRQRPSIVVVDPHTRSARKLTFPPVVRTAWLWTTAGRHVPGRHPVLVNGLPELRTGAARTDSRTRFVGPLLGAMTTRDPGLPWDRIRAERVLLVSPGTVFTPSVARMRALAEAMADSGWTVVLATGRVQVGALGPLPANVFAHQSLPQLEVLRHADVFLTHGGMNSVLEAIACGVPMLVRPRIGEQRKTAAKIAELGLGRLVHRRSSLLTQLEHVAGDPDIRRRVRGLQRRMSAMYSAGRAADELLALPDVTVKC
jgi:UDP:flavonoid glycosyltransferase YjiC (YdhE family)